MSDDELENELEKAMAREREVTSRPLLAHAAYSFKDIDWNWEKLTAEEKKIISPTEMVRIRWLWEATRDDS